MRYLRHLRRLYQQYRFPFLAEFLQFGAVGATGFAVDLALYLALQGFAGLGHVAARALSFWGAATWNWGWNRLLTFSHRREDRQAGAVAGVPAYLAARLRHQRRQLLSCSPTTCRTSSTATSWRW
ncbi:MAG: GtrA family protein [Chromatiales bacterium]|nr:GtrA family protein [Chromatiales bacterium]